MTRWKVTLRWKLQGEPMGTVSAVHEADGSLPEDADFDVLFPDETLPPMTKDAEAAERLELLVLRFERLPYAT